MESSVVSREDKENVNSWFKVGFVCLFVCFKLGITS